MSWRRLPRPVSASVTESVRATLSMRSLSWSVIASRPTTTARAPDAHASVGISGLGEKAMMTTIPSATVPRTTGTALRTQRSGVRCGSGLQAATARSQVPASQPRSAAPPWTWSPTIDVASALESPIVIATSPARLTAQKSRRQPPWATAAATRPMSRTSARG